MFVDLLVGFPGEYGYLMRGELLTLCYLSQGLGRSDPAVEVRPGDFASPLVDVLHAESTLFERSRLEKHMRSPTGSLGFTAVLIRLHLNSIYPKLAIVQAI